MLIKGNGAIKSIMNENVKENQSHKSIVCIVYKGRCGFPQLYCTFEFPKLSSSFISSGISCQILGARNLQYPPIFDHQHNSNSPVIC